MSSKDDNTSRDKQKPVERSASERRRHRNYQGADDRALPKSSPIKNKDKRGR